MVDDYLRDNYFTRQNVQKSSFDLNVAASRLILLIMPELDKSAVFNVEFNILINQIYSWAKNGEEPLRSYATGLLAGAMEVQETVCGYVDENADLVGIMLQRLQTFKPSKFKIPTDFRTFFKNKYTRNIIPLYPPTYETNQMLILRYLTSIGQYQEVSTCFQ